MNKEKGFGFRKQLLGPLVVVLIFCLSSANSCEEYLPNDIKTGSYWTSPVMNQTEVRELAKHDLLIVDMENGINNRQSLKLLKTLNPRIKLICYSNPMEFFKPMPDNRPIQSRWLKEVEENFPHYFLKLADGSPAKFWPGMVMLNLSNYSDFGNWMAEKLLSEVLSDPIWDGYFMDNGGGNISWVIPNNRLHRLDVDADGFSDANQKVDDAWYQGIYQFLFKIRTAKGKDFIIISNKGSVEMMDLVDGRMFETFPCDYLGSKENFGWNQSMKNAKEMEAIGAKYTIFQGKEKDLNLILASALLLDNVYVMIDHNNSFFYPIFDLKIGEALDSCQTFQERYFRTYDGGNIEVNPKYLSGEISPR